MDKTIPPLENTQANPPLGEFFTDPKIGNFLQEMAAKCGLRLDAHRGLYELPRGIQLHRFKGEKIVKLIGQYRNEENHEHPNHVYTIEVHKSEVAETFVSIQEDGKCLMSINFNGSSLGAEYVAIKALKAVLHRRDRRNLRKRNQEHKRKELKKAAAQNLKG